MTKYTDVMLDMETLGTAPGSAIISVGAVAFSEEMDEADWSVYRSGPVSWASCAAIGLTADTATLEWWSQQDVEARKVFDASMWHTAADIVDVLHVFAGWYPQGARLWSNGANFDGVLLREAYRRAMLPPPCQYWEEACYRTMKNLWPTVPPPVFEGVKHDALDDARHQAEHLAAILAHVKDLKRRAINNFIAAHGEDGAPANTTCILRDSSECVTELKWRGDFPNSTKVYAIGGDGIDTYVVCDAYGFDLADMIAKSHNDELGRRHGAPA